MDRHAQPERQHYNVTLAILMLAGIAFALQQTMVIPALPALQRELDTSTAWATWVLTASCSCASVADAAPRASSATSTARNASS